MTDWVSNVQTYSKNDVDTHSFSYFLPKTGFCLANRSEAWFLADNSLKMCGDVIFEMSLSLVSQIKVLGWPMNETKPQQGFSLLLPFAYLGI